MDESLLPPPEPPKKPFPWRAAALAFVPAAALAAGTGLSRWLDSAHGDVILRWLFWSSGAGAIVGALVAAFLRPRFAWPLYGIAAPWLAAGLVVAGMRVARPFREHLADRREAGCRAAGRQVCNAQEFRAACDASDRDRLGTPHQSRCAAGACTQRWTYDGPFRPETVPPRTILLCSVVTDAKGKTVRASMMAVADPRE
jgi:hypothetical protein